MKIKDIFINMSYTDLTRHYAGTKQNPTQLEKQLYVWYARSKTLFGYDESILNVALTIGIRTRNNKDYYIPNNNYLTKILDRFKLFKVETLEDAIDQLQFNLSGEIYKNTKVKEKQPKEFKNEPWVDEYLQELKDEVTQFEANERGH